MPKASKAPKVDAKAATPKAPKESPKPQPTKAKATPKAEAPKAEAPKAKEPKAEAPDQLRQQLEATFANLQSLTAARDALAIKVDQLTAALEDARSEYLTLDYASWLAANDPKAASAYMTHVAQALLSQRRHIAKVRESEAKRQAKDLAEIKQVLTPPKVGKAKAA